MPKKRVVITGIGIVSPVGNNRESTWKAVLEGKSGIDKITVFDTEKFPCKIAGEVKNFSIDTVIPEEKRKLKKYIARGAGFGIAASYEAMEDAGLLDSNGIDKKRLGVCIGNSGQRAFLNNWTSIHKAYCENFKNMPFINVTDFLKNKYHTCSELISIFHGAEAFNYSISTACASGTQALGLAGRMIQNNQADVVIAGGCDSMINEIDLMSFCLLGAVTTSFNENPTEGSCPFSKKRSGFVLGEGGAVLILEELEHALKRGVRIYGELTGYGTTMSAYSLTDPPPNGDAAYSSMKAALKDAGMEAEKIDYINAHGTSTRDNDLTETLSIKRLFGERAYNIPVSSTKSTTAHLISGAGAIEAAFCALAIRDDKLPPTMNLNERDGQCDLDYIPLTYRSKRIDCALSNSLGFGGSNATIVINRF